MAKRKETSKGAQVVQQSKGGKRTKSSVDNSHKRAPKGLAVSQNKSHAAQSAIGQSTSNAVVDRRLPKAKSSKVSFCLAIGKPNDQFEYGPIKIDL